MFRSLREIDPGMITTATPSPQSWSSMYSQLSSCKEDLSWANYQTYSDTQFNPCWATGGGNFHCSIPSVLSTMASSYGGFSKVAWGVSTESQNFRPPVGKAIAFQQEFQWWNPEMRGVMIWNSEFSSVCSPPWCYDNLLARAMAGEEIQQNEVEECNCDGKATPSGHG